MEPLLKLQPTVSCRYGFSSLEIFVVEARKPYIIKAVKGKAKPVSCLFFLKHKTCLRYLVVWNASSLGCGNELGTCSHTACWKSEEARPRALFSVCVCFGSGSSPWMPKTMMSTCVFFMKFSQVGSVRAKWARTSLRMHALLMGTRSNLKLPGTPIHSLLAWRMVLWETTSAMATIEATMMVRTWL